MTNMLMFIRCYLYEVLVDCGVDGFILHIVIVTNDCVDKRNKVVIASTHYMLLAPLAITSERDG
jgi:hypothetical protein